MIIKDNKVIEIFKMNIFGYGEIYAQLVPLLESAGIKLADIFDDTKIGMEFHAKKYSELATQETLFCIGYKDMLKRYQRFVELKQNGVKFVTYIANNAIMSKNAFLDNGSIINQGTIIDNFVSIGECVFINIGCTVSHHTKIHSNVFIAPGVNIAGYVNVKEGVFLGINSTIIDHITIGEYSVIAAGAVVTQDVPPYCMVAGNPAKIKKKFNLG